MAFPPGLGFYWEVWQFLGSKAGPVHAMHGAPPPSSTPSLVNKNAHIFVFHWVTQIVEHCMAPPAGSCVIGWAIGPISQWAEGHLTDTNYECLWMSLGQLPWIVLFRRKGNFSKQEMVVSILPAPCYVSNKKDQPIKLQSVSFFCSVKVWTQGLKLARQVLYHSSQSTSPVFISLQRWGWNPTPQAR
jgi:hypothetical protein